MVAIYSIAARCICAKFTPNAKPIFEIWLGLEYRLLPVKFRQIDSSDEVTDEFVIADIRAAEE